jgi:hypothetical protein
LLSNILREQKIHKMLKSFFSQHENYNFATIGTIFLLFRCAKLNYGHLKNITLNGNEIDKGKLNVNVKDIKQKWGKRRK